VLDQGLAFPSLLSSLGTWEEKALFAAGVGSVVAGNVKGVTRQGQSPDAGANAQRSRSSRARCKRLEWRKNYIKRHTALLDVGNEMNERG